MRYKLMLLGVVFLRTSGCEQHPLTDYRPLDQAGMWSSTVEQLKSLNTSDVEVVQLVKLKQAGISDDACVTLITDARGHHRLFTSADSAVNLAHAGYSESQILEIAKTDQLDSISGDAVMLRLVGLSNRGVDMILHRRLKGQPTMSSAEIGRLKNTGLTEKQILERINAGMTDAAADKEAALREATRNHSGTGFTRVRGHR
jgi:hypothetical protein